MGGAEVSRAKRYRWVFDTPHLVAFLHRHRRYRGVFPVAEHIAEAVRWNA